MHLRICPYLYVAISFKQVFPLHWPWKPQRWARGLPAFLQFSQILSFSWRNTWVVKRVCEFCPQGTKGWLQPHAQGDASSQRWLWWSVCDWVLPACITPYLYWPLINIDDQLCTGNPFFSLFVLGGQQPGLRATHQARNNFTLIALPRVLIKQYL